VRDEGTHALGVAEILVAKAIGGERLRLRGESLQNPILTVDDGTQAFAQMFRMEQLPDAHATHAADLVLIARADTATGGADGLGGAKLPMPLGFHMVREDDV